ncbi:hypothetical protein PR048_010498 [Dryococelus australis]|uniref:Uncharacterized protein n=1 Tax=Dryococelus australis TaxID=614101 RepID=A0ABQ9I2V7_9NEOP|nr:hypothetical protein PR048_010498 [Dryococelus australis]
MTFIVCLSGELTVCQERRAAMSTCHEYRVTKYTEAKWRPGYFDVDSVKLCLLVKLWNSPTVELQQGFRKVANNPSAANEFFSAGLSAGNIAHFIANRLYQTLIGVRRSDLLLASDIILLACAANFTVCGGGAAVRLLGSRRGEPGSIPGEIAPEFSHMGIVSCDVSLVGVFFSGVSRFPRPRIPAMLHTHLASPSSVLKTSLLRAALIPPLHCPLHSQCLPANHRHSVLEFPNSNWPTQVRNCLPTKTRGRKPNENCTYATEHLRAVNDGRTYPPPRIFLVHCPDDRRPRSQCYWPMEGVSATAIRKVLLQSRSYPGSMFEGVIRQAAQLRPDHFITANQKKNMTRSYFHVRIFHRPIRCRGGAVVRLISSDLGETGPIPDGVAPGFSQVGIVPDDAVGRRVFSVFSRFPRPCIPVPLHIRLALPSLHPYGLSRPRCVRAVQIFPLHSIADYSHEAVVTGLRSDWLFARFKLFTIGRPAGEPGSAMLLASNDAILLVRARGAHNARHNFTSTFSSFLRPQTNYSVEGSHAVRHPPFISSTNSEATSASYFQRRRPRLVSHIPPPGSSSGEKRTECDGRFHENHAFLRARQTSEKCEVTVNELYCDGVGLIRTGLASVSSLR